MSLECVVLLHGLARTNASMSVMEKLLINEGYVIVNHGYASRKKTIENLAEEAISQALKKCPQETSKIHFVTHSLGGILLRQYLSHNTIKKIDKVIMLGPPNHGSEVVDRFNKYHFFKRLNGPAGLQLGTSKGSVPNTVGSWPNNAGELGIIAGKQSINLLLSCFIPAPNDGKVSVESTKLKGMKDHKVMATTHPMMMRNKKVINQVIMFLRNGRFN